MAGGFGFGAGGAAPASTGAAAGLVRWKQLDRLRWRYFVSILVFSFTAHAW